MYRLLILLTIAWIFSAGPVRAQSVEPLKPKVHRLSPSPDLQYRLQALVIQAVPGDVIEFGEGRFELLRQIDIATDNLTLRGQGMEKTILTFKGQKSGGQGIEATGNNFMIERLAIEDTAGNAVKVLGARNVTFRELRTEWTGEAKSSNGAYGIYPVQCSNVLIDSCVAMGASDSGIYVGQSRGVVVKNSRAERNVAGIEIENTVDAAVFDNLATNNTGGILVFDLPGLQQKAGGNVRLYHNRVNANNHPNFAAPGNIVALVPRGTGLMIMATDQVEVFDNDITDHHTANVALLSYYISGKKINDKTYDAFSEGISIHDNRISRGGAKPGGPMGDMLAPALGTPLPDILFDGMVDPRKLVAGELPEALRLSIVNNGKATFANFKLSDLNPDNVRQGKYQPSPDLTPYTRPRPALAEASLKDHDPPSPMMDKTVLAYRAAPAALSEHRLFEGNGATQKPADGVVPYTLNATLFSDETSKYRFIRIPKGTSIRYTEDGPLDFPEGTLIAKTFAYPIDRRDPSKGERLLETRIQVLQENKWHGYSYRWNEAQSEALLLLGGGEFDVSWIHHDGTRKSNRYEIPNANQCLSCHSQNKDYVPIGPTAMNLNRDMDFGKGKVNQLDYLATIHWLEKLPSPEKRRKMPIPEDSTTGSLDQRARAWLHVNCAHCHSPEGTARTSGLDLRSTQTEPGRFGVWKPPVAAGHGSGGREYDIVPGEADRSILLYRMQSQDPSIRMPNVARNLMPSEAVALIHEWISAMPKEK